MANFAHVENGNIVGVYDLLPKNWKNISNFFVLENDEDTLRSHGWYKLIKVTPTGFNNSIHKLDNPRQWFENGAAYETYEIFALPSNLPPPSPPPPSEEELALIVARDLEARWQFVRDERDRKIKDFEWRYFRYERQVRLGTTPTDNLVDLDSYVQALADITTQSDPYNITWPNYEL